MKTRLRRWRLRRRAAWRVLRGYPMAYRCTFDREVEILVRDGEPAHAYECEVRP